MNKSSNLLTILATNSLRLAGVLFSPGLIEIFLFIQIYIYICVGNKRVGWYIRTYIIIDVDLPPFLLRFMIFFSYII